MHGLRQEGEGPGRQRICNREHGERKYPILSGNAREKVGSNR